MGKAEPSRSSRKPKPQGDTDQDRGDDLAVIREQTRETIALLRQLVEMLLPKGDPDKPKLEDLLSALVAQQARTLLLLKQLSADISALVYHLMPNGREDLDGHHHDNGSTRP